KCKSKNELDLNSSDLDDVDLIIPNKEILNIFNQSFFKTIKNIIQQQIFDKHDQKIDELIEALFSGVESRVGDILTNFLNSTISFFDYSESFYHAYLLGILSCKFNDVKSNREVGLGRSDIQVKPNNKTHGMIIEVKWVEEEKLLLKSAIEALDQIEKNKYDFDLRQNYSTIIYWGISFFKKQCLAKFKIS
ncbi:MAG: PD-(D/E)XK nuclease domain-containing protein, partial [Desulfovibrionaceae bacterium]|nr:PD-(D/E)XK nuclease domain-containing protein [Desulfovibrionaceae bacterium]